MHHVGGSTEWYPATPPKGTGVHEYVAYKGDAPCAENGSCDGCGSPAGDVLCSVAIDPKDCSVKNDENVQLEASVTRQNSASKHKIKIVPWMYRALISVFAFAIWQ